jgi:indolepyruvate ferredoxin oxidoreductase
VAKYYFKLMAYKDEYEVARLYTNGEFTDKLKQQFEGDFSLKFNLAPPIFSKKDGQGHLVKAQYGSWVWQAFKLLAKCKVCAARRWISLDIPQNVNPNAP